MGDGAGDAAPRRVRLRRTAGWRKPPDAVVVSRPGRWGNPFDVRDGGRERAVAAHREWLLSRPDLVALARAELAGRDLCCWCPPELACHADTLLEVANGG